MSTQSFQSCPTLCDLMDRSPPGSSVHGIIQARTLEWFAMTFSRSSQPRDQACISCVSCIGMQALYYQHHLGSPYQLILTISLLPSHAFSPEQLDKSVFFILLGSKIALSLEVHKLYLLPTVPSTEGQKAVAMGSQGHVGRQKRCCSAALAC